MANVEERHHEPRSSKATPAFAANANSDAGGGEEAGIPGPTLVRLGRNPPRPLTFAEKSRQEIDDSTDSTYAEDDSARYDRLTTT